MADATNTPADEDAAYDLDDLVTVDIRIVFGDPPKYQVGRVLDAVPVLTAARQRVYIYEIERGEMVAGEFEPDDDRDSEWYGAGELTPYEAPEHPHPDE